MSQPLLQVVVGSTRPGREGLAVARWVSQLADAHGGFDVELVDLAEVGLPVFDEPEHPRLQRYTRSTPVTGAPSCTARTRSCS